MLGGNCLLLGLAVTWLTPLWLLSVGATLFLAGLAVVYGILKLAAPRVALGSWCMAYAKGCCSPCFILSY